MPIALHISVHSFERNSPSGDASVITMIELLGGDIPEVTLSHEVSAKKIQPRKLIKTHMLA